VVLMLILGRIVVLLMALGEQEILLLSGLPLKMIIMRIGLGVVFRILIKTF